MPEGNVDRECDFFFYLCRVGLFLSTHTHMSLSVLHPGNQSSRTNSSQARILKEGAEKGWWEVWPGESSNGKLERAGGPDLVPKP